MEASMKSAIRSLRAHFLLAAGLALLPCFEAGAQAFTDISAGLTGVRVSSAAWGDYDNDGDLDILLAGEDAGFNLIAKVYRNTGGVFSDINAGLTGVYFGSVAWGDYDNDGDLDILLTGNVGGTFVAKVYQNTGVGFTELLSAGLAAVDQSSVAWGDYDNDGDLDILLTGRDSGSNPVAKVYENTGSGFTEFSAGLAGVEFGSVAWGDYDNDGDLDIVLAGRGAGFNNRIAKVYENTGSGFTEFSAGLTGVEQSSVAWGDYDNDGDLDVLLTGETGINNPIAKVYRNTGSGFTDIVAGLSAVERGPAAWSDYDNDGDLDILLGGVDATATVVTRIYQNTGGVFSDISAGLTGLFTSSAAWGDYDNDGDLDILLAGQNSGNVPMTKVYRNDGTVFNTVPSAPANLSESVSGSSVTFSWDPSTDTQTPSAGLTYNLMVGTTSNGIDINSPMANVSNGYRRVVRLGGTNHNESWTLNDLPDDCYFWRVQAVDHAFAGSPFSEEGTFCNTTVSPLNLTHVRLRQDVDGGNGAITLRGEFIDNNVVPPFTAPPVEVEVTDNLSLGQIHVFMACTTSRSRVRCTDRVGSSSFAATFRPLRQQPDVIRFKITFRRLSIDGPFEAPVTVTIRHSAGVVRSDAVDDCRATGVGLDCREF
jgi:predicted nucleotidyltransferase